MDDFDKDLREVLDRALKGGITHIIAIGINVSSSIKSLELAKTYDFVFSTIGFHPHNADDADPDRLNELSRLVGPKVVAWGEIGLDFFRLNSPPEKQIKAFERQMEMAASFDLPVIIHDREAHTELLEVLKRHRDKNSGGVIHCFSGDYDLAMALIEMGYYISIPGTVTFKNAHMIQDVASRIPLEYMLVETDAPFLAPVPKRGKRNEPLFVTHTARKIAQLREMDFGEIARQTAENTKRIFRLPD